MRAAWFAAVAAVVLMMATPAFADAPKTSLFVEFGAGSDYSFVDGASLPTFDQSSISTTYTFGVKRGDWTLAFSYLEAKHDLEGSQVALSYDQDVCPLISEQTDRFNTPGAHDPGDNYIGCSFGILVRDVEHEQTVKYTAGVRGPIGLLRNNQFRPRWVVAGAAVSGDRTETTLRAGIEAPFSFSLRTAADTVGTRDARWFWTVTASAGLVHGFEADTTLPTWGVNARYNFNDTTSLTVGYESRVVLNPDVEDDLDVDRAVTARFKYQF